MGGAWKSLVVVVGFCCVIASQSAVLRESVETKEPDNVDLLFERYAELQEEEEDDDDEEEEFGNSVQESAEREEKTTARSLEPEAEMLPAHYEGVKPPGVDHMEMTEFEKDKLQTRRYRSQPPLPAGKKISTNQLEPRNLRMFRDFKHRFVEI